MDAMWKSLEAAVTYAESLSNDAPGEEGLSQPTSEPSRVDKRPMEERDAGMARMPTTPPRKVPKRFADAPWHAGNKPIIIPLSTQPKQEEVATTAAEFATGERCSTPRSANDARAA